jgi:hypothetical protein
VSPTQLSSDSIPHVWCCRVCATLPQASGALEPLRGGAGLAKKLGLKNIGMLTVLLSLLYLPRAMGTCASRINPRSGKIERMGCGSSLMVTNLMTLGGLGLVLMNSRQFDRHGRSKVDLGVRAHDFVCFQYSCKARILMSPVRDFPCLNLHSLC